MFEIHPVVAAMMTRNLMDRMSGAQQQNVAAEWKAHVEDLQEQLVLTQAQLKAALVVLNAYKEVHPTSPLHQTSNVVFTRGQNAGKAKRQSTLIWEQAFDAAAKEMGISNPTALRDD